jgi:hypothetical protein
MEDSDVRTVSDRIALGRPARWPLVATFALVLASGCAGRFAGPRTLAGLGAVAVVAGSVTWAAGEGLERNGHAGGALVTTGFVGVATGLVAIVAAGGWMALAVACKVDPDCAEDEQCREIPAPPGGVPYKQCMSR